MNLEAGRRGLCEKLLEDSNVEPPLFGTLYRPNIALRQILICHCGESAYKPHDDTGFYGEYLEKWEESKTKTHNQVTALRYGMNTAQIDYKATLRLVYGSDDDPTMVGIKACPLEPEYFKKGAATEFSPRSYR